MINLRNGKMVKTLQWVDYGKATSLLLLMSIALLLAGCTTRTSAQTDCLSTLELGSNIFKIVPLQASQDGSYRIPANKSNQAFLVGESLEEPVFIFSGTRSNTDLALSLRIGDEIFVNGSECNRVKYRLVSIGAELMPMAGTIDHPDSGLSIYIPAPGIDTGSYVIKAIREEDQQVSTVEPHGEVLLLQVDSSQAEVLLVRAAIQNYGVDPITVTSGEVAIISPNTGAVKPLATDPDLPLLIQPGSTAFLDLAFSKPDLNLATLRILEKEFALFFP